jgi:transcriptional regulator with XRE-family HTH domain
LSVEAAAIQRLLDPAARLREAREQKGLSVRQVAEATKLSVRAVELLERNCVSGLPDGGIYRRSIVRAIAREVGLDPEQSLAEFTALHPDALPAPDRAVVVEPQAARSYSKAIAFVSAMLPMLAGAAYFTMPNVRSQPMERERPAVTERRIEPARAEIVPVGGFSEMPAAARPVPVVVTLTISSRCQLRVVADGNEIVGRTMEQGETLPIELGEELLLLGDNASAVQFSINGQAGRLLGEPGDVLSTRIGRDDYQDFLVRY